MKGHASLRIIIHYKKNWIYLRPKSVGNDQNQWVIRHYPWITDGLKSVGNEGVGKFPTNFDRWVIFPQNLFRGYKFILPLIFIHG